MTALSWQPPPVTKCGDCLYQYGDECDFSIENSLGDRRLMRQQNKDGITESCPAWRQQNKAMQELANHSQSIGLDM